MKFFAKHIKYLIFNDISIKFLIFKVGENHLVKLNCRKLIPTPVHLF